MKSFVQVPLFLSHYTWRLCDYNLPFFGSPWGNCQKPNKVWGARKIAQLNGDIVLGENSINTIKSSSFVSYGSSLFLLHALVLHILLSSYSHFENIPFSVAWP